MTDDRVRRSAQAEGDGARLLSRLAELRRRGLGRASGWQCVVPRVLPNAVQEPHEEDTDVRAVDLIQEEEDEVCSTLVLGRSRELSSFDDLTGDIAI
jgi:hypothetical protein